MKKILATVLLITGFLLGTGSTVFAAFRVVQTPVYHLYTGESGSATTVRITPYPVDLDNAKLTMTDFGTNAVFTVDPGLKGIEEIEQFTGIVDNGDGTASLTGLSRDMQSKYPYTGSGTGRTHGSSAIVVFGNSPQIYGRLAAPENAQTWSAVQIFASTTPPQYDSNYTASGNQFVSFNQLLTTAFQGAATSTYSGMGIVQLATAGQVSAGTASSTTGAPFVIPSADASSTYNGPIVFQGEIPALRSTKDIDPNFIATSSGNNYNWGGITTFTGSTTMATTSIAASGTSTSPLILHGVPYAFPATQGANGTSLLNNGSGTLSWGAKPQYTLISNTAIQASSNTATSTQILTIPAGTLSASSTITVQGEIDCQGGSASCQYYLRDLTSGVTFATCIINQSTTAVNYSGLFHFTVANQGSLSAQLGYSDCFTIPQNAAIGSGGIYTQVGAGVTATTFNTANAVNLVLVAKSPSNQANINDYSIIVNP